MIPFKSNLISEEQGVSGGIFIIFAKQTSSNLPFGAMMLLMVLHGIVMQYKDADAHRQTDICGRTLTDIVSNNGKVWRGAGGWDGMQGVALQYHGVVRCVFVVDYETTCRCTR